MSDSVRCCKGKLIFVSKVPLPSATLHKLSRIELKARGLADERLSLHYRKGIILAQSDVEIITGISKKFIQCLLGYILDRLQHIKIPCTKKLTIDKSQETPATMLTKNFVFPFFYENIK